MPPIRLYRAGREVQSSRRYFCRADQAGGPTRLLIQRSEAGCGTVIMGERRHAVAPGRALVLAIPGPGVWAYEGDGTPWRFSYASVTCPIAPDLTDTPVIDLEPGGVVERAFTTLVDRRLQGDVGPQAALAYQLLLGAVGLATDPGQHGPEDHLAERLTASGGHGRLARLAEDIGISHAALTRRFVKRFGEPPRAWAERLRLREACVRLAAGDAPGVAAEAAGYGDSAHFGRAFRRRLGLTPGAWSALADALRPWP